MEVQIVFIDYLKTEFKIKWLNKNTSQIKFNKSDNLIEIVEKKDSLILKLNPKIEKAILSIKTIYYLHLI